jgi:protein strawberry notch
LDNYLKGRQKAIWISVSPILIADCKRDLNDVIRDTDVTIEVFQLPKKYQVIDNSKGILFVTYSSLGRTRIGEVPNDEFKSRLNQIVNWLGKTFDGVVSYLRLCKCFNCFNFAICISDYFR